MSCISSPKPSNKSSILTFPKYSHVLKPWYITVSIRFPFFQYSNSSIENSFTVYGQQNNDIVGLFGKGRTSEVQSDILQGKGVDTWSVRGASALRSKVTHCAPGPSYGFDRRMFERPSPITLVVQLPIFITILYVTKIRRS
jgi:hypothetical protein